MVGIDARVVSASCCSFDIEPIGDHGKFRTRRKLRQMLSPGSVKRCARHWKVEKAPWCRQNGFGCCRARIRRREDFDALATGSILRSLLAGRSTASALEECARGRAVGSLTGLSYSINTPNFLHKSGNLYTLHDPPRPPRSTNLSLRKL